MFCSPSRFSVVVVVILGWKSSSLGQLAPASRFSASQLPDGPSHAQVANLQSSGTITGAVVDQSGAVVRGAQVKLMVDGKPVGQPVSSDDHGQFSFLEVPPGHFQLTVTAAGFSPQNFSDTLQPGQGRNLLPIALGVAPASTSVQVGLSQIEVATEEVKIEEKQRVLGIVPNFYVSYASNAAPLDAKLKFKLALKTMVDPFTLVFVAGVAGVQQAQDHFRTYGLGAQGYAKRFGANYADTFDGTFLGDALFPALFKQDPRYFYKGTGSTRSRALYAIANSVICKGDNGKWQPNYSAVLGNLAAGGLSNLYYPPEDRHGAGLTFDNAGIGIAGRAAANLFQEFVVKKLTPKIHGHGAGQP
jgi:hypothetical protein